MNNIPRLYPDIEESIYSGKIQATNSTSEKTSTASEIVQQLRAQDVVSK